jgi:hypothetical protein
MRRYPEVKDNVLLLPRLKEMLKDMRRAVKQRRILLKLVSWICPRLKQSINAR